MKNMNIFKSLTVAAAVGASVSLTGCLEETIPSSTITESQLNSSPATGNALVWSMPAWLNNFNTSGQDAHYDWGYGSIIHIRDVMTGDMAIASSNYDHYTAWEQNRSISEIYATTGFVWSYLNKQIQPANDAIRFYKQHSENTDFLGYLGMAYAFRAFGYLDLARMYEFLPNDKVSGVNDNGNDVTGLTVPYVTEDVTQEMAVNNPRLPHYSRPDFLNGANISDSILRDLNEAERLLEGVTRADKTLPDLSVVYGLKARYYMWNEDYPKAQEYARLAINTSTCTPTTEAEWTSATSGFNSISANSWMWGSQLVAENRLVTTGIINWTSWRSNETTYGYASAGPMLKIGTDEMYSRISDYDFRKLSWVAPEGSPLQGKETFVNPVFSPYEEGENALAPYCSLKFRPNLGDYSNYLTGSASGYPLMRIEEMYFIEAEAAAHSNPAQGKQLLSDFMRKYRYGLYSTNATSLDDVVEEIVFQKRVELWGEGQTFFDIKRLNMSVTRATNGSNFEGYSRLNTTGRPAWMNLVIVRSEGQNNPAVRDWNNPTTDNAYTPLL